MNPNYLLDREYFNLNSKKEEKKTKEPTPIKQNGVFYMDRNTFQKQEPLFLQQKEEQTFKQTINIQQDEKDKKLQDMQFNPYVTQYRNQISVDRIGFNDSNKKEQTYYQPYQRNIMVENRNLNRLDFIDKNKKSEYYKNVDLKKFNPNINYKDFIN